MGLKVDLLAVAVSICVSGHWRREPGNCRLRPTNAYKSSEAGDGAMSKVEAGVWELEARSSDVAPSVIP